MTQEFYFESMMQGGAVLIAPAEGSAIVYFEFDPPRFFADVAAARHYLTNHGFSEN